MRDTLIVIAAVILLRVPFLNQAIQGDDPNYLTAAQYAQTDPAHPGHVWLIFQGERVTMQGHPHPPLNSWTLAALLAATKDIQEVPYHAAYAIFSLIAALSALSLARKFSQRPLAATLLFLATPAFIINGNSLESDLPLLAFWLMSIALFIKAVDKKSTPLLIAAAATMPFAALAAYQSVMLIPILGIYLWNKQRDWLIAWFTLLAVPVTLGAWQLFERLTSDTLPAEVLAGYFKTYNLHSPINKARNALALTVHLGWMVFPIVPLIAFKPGWWIMAVLPLAWFEPNAMFLIAVAAGVAILAEAIRNRNDFLAQWLLLFFAAALILFFAGSARYLLPIALPTALLIERKSKAKWITAAIACNAILGLALAKVNYDHWNGYREVITKLEKDWSNKRVWVNGELGWRFYAESAGALPLVRGQAVRPGDIIINSKLTAPVAFTTGGGATVPLGTYPITSKIPLRIIGLESRSGYSESKGFRPFDIRTNPIDVLEQFTVTERKPELSYLPMNAPEAEKQIISGVDKLEDQRYRWMGKKAVILLKNPGQPSPIQIAIFVPDQAPATKIKVTVDGNQILEADLKKGPNTITKDHPQPKEETSILTIEVDKTFQSPGDQRILGAILSGAGFQPAAGFPTRPTR